MIYLLRHGDAEDGHGDDAARRLTPKGERRRDRAADLRGAGTEAGDRRRAERWGLAIVDGSTILALLRPDDLAAIAAS